MRSAKSLCLVVLTVFAAACGGGDASSPTVASVSDLVENQPDSSTELAADVDIAGASPTDSEAADEGTDTDAAAVDAAESMTEEERVLAFAQCLRDEGLDATDPTVNSDGSMNLRSVFPRPEGLADGEAAGPPEGFREAFETCGPLVEDLRQARREGVDQTAREDSLLEYAQCIRDNGFDMPDPDFSSPRGPGSSGPFGDIDRNDPALAEANEACQDILAGAGLGGGRRGGPGGAGQGQGQGQGQATP